MSWIGDKVNFQKNSFLYNSKNVKGFFDQTAEPRKSLIQLRENAGLYDHYLVKQSKFVCITGNTYGWLVVVLLSHNTSD